jgi:hypothetical protein
MSRTAWLVLAVSVVVFMSIIAIGFARDRLAFDVSRRVSGATSTSGVELQTQVSLGERSGGYDVVAKVSILNTTDAAIPYVGVPCYDPARVRFASTRLAPAGPVYSPPAAALRSHVMEYRRSLDEVLGFTDIAGKASAACDESGLPVLPAHETLTYTLTGTLGVPSQLFIDPATTEVVTTVRLGHLAATVPGQRQQPLLPGTTLEVRNSLASLSKLTKPSAANYSAVSRHFDLLMNDHRVAAWVNAQDGSGWRAARFMDPYPQNGAWRLTAFSRAWATPLVVTGSDVAITAALIPTDPSVPAPATDAVIPPGAVSGDKISIPWRDLYVGDLVLPSGRVMVGDIVSGEGMLRFDYGLAPGRYPIHVVTARPRYLGDDYEVAAWEELVLSSSPVTHWKAAIPVGHTENELQPGSVFTFGTDGGGGGFASPEAMAVMDASDVTDDDGVYLRLGEREEANGWLWGLMTLDSATGANVFGTSTGADGAFPVLVGLDAKNRPAMLLSDFNALEMSYSGIHAS